MVLEPTLDKNRDPSIYHPRPSEPKANLLMLGSIEKPSERMSCFQDWLPTFIAEEKYKAQSFPSEDAKKKEVPRFKDIDSWKVESGKTVAGSSLAEGNCACLELKTSWSQSTWCYLLGMIGKPLNLPKYPYYSCLRNGFLKIADTVIQHLLCDFSLHQT